MQVSCLETKNTLTHFELAGDLQLGRRDAQGVVHEHHGEDGDEDGKVADDGPHLREKRESGRSESRPLSSTQSHQVAAVRCRSLIIVIVIVPHIGLVGDIRGHES